MDYHHPSGEVHIIDNNEWVSCPGLLVRSSRGVQCFKVDVLAPRPYVCRLQPVRPRRQVFTMILCSALASLLIFNLGNDASQIGKLGADNKFCPFLCVQKNQPCVNGQRQVLYHVFKNCYSSSGHVRFVDTFRDVSNRSFGGCYMVHGA